MDRRQRALIILAATFAVSHLDRQIMSVSLNAMGQEFSLSDTQLGLLSGGVFASVFAVCGIPLARLAAWYPRRIIIAISVLVWSGLTVLTSGAQTFAHLLVTRLGVGIGEAGGVAPAHSLISDLFPENRRTSAFAVLVSGGNIGVLFAFLIGGIVGQTIGWRWAFVIAGLPGLVLAVLVWRYVDEPKRPSPTPGDLNRSLFVETLRHFWNDKGLLHALLAVCITGVVTYGALSWNAVFIIRVHGLNVAQAGVVLALVIGVGGTLGAFFSGRLADRLGQRDPRWRIGVAGIAVLVAKPFVLCFLFLESTPLALASFAVSASLATVFWAPSFAYMHGRLPSELRPMATAITLFAFNIIGMGLGPTVVGALSDQLAITHGPRSIGVALSVIQVCGVWAAFHYWKVTQSMKPHPPSG